MDKSVRAEFTAPRRFVRGNPKGEEGRAPCQAVSSDVASRIRSLLRERGLTQADLCRMTGLTSAIVSQVSSGTTQDPRLSTVSAVARALGVSVDYLAFGFRKPVDYTDGLQEQLNENYVQLDYHDRIVLCEHADMLARLRRLES